MKPQFRILHGDSLTTLRTLPEKSVHCIVTSPPYFGLRDYKVAGQIGLEPTPGEYLTNLVDLFREARRVLRDDGTCWVNMGDSYANDGKWGGQTGGKHRRALHGATPNVRNKRYTGFKPKDLMGMPWRLALAMQDDGWYLRSDIIWHKPNVMPESVADRPTKSHEYLFLFSKSPQYYFDQIAISEPVTGNAHTRGTKLSPPKAAANVIDGNGHEGWHASTRDLVELRRPRTVWRISTQSYKGAHFATFPLELPRRCVKAATSEHGVCSNCGAPWIRIVEKSRKPTRTGKNTKLPAGWNSGPGSHNTLDGRYKHDVGYEKGSVPGNHPTEFGNRDPQRHVTTLKTAGWKPGCQCETTTVIPATVLDPFSGSGTTGLASMEQGRDYLGIELNLEYIALSYHRLKPVAHRLF